MKPDQWTIHLTFKNKEEAREVCGDLIRNGGDVARWSSYTAEITGVFDPDGVIHHVVWVRKSIAPGRESLEREGQE